MPGQSRGGSLGPAQDWGRLRMWDGSQYRAFEELCFQVRDPAPPGWRTIKTGNPDGGVEWYDHAPGGRTHGSQAKFVGRVADLIPLARESVRTVGANRGFRNVVKLTFFAPFDMPDPPPQTRTGRQQQGARQRWNAAVQGWKTDLPGVADIEIDFVGGGELLERLSRPGNEGRRWFFFNELVLGPQWCADRFEIAQRVAQDRYTPERHITLPTTRVLDGLAVSRSFRQRLVRRVDAARDAVAELMGSWARWREIQEPAVVAAGVDFAAMPNPGAPAAVSDLATHAGSLADQLASTVQDAGAATGVPSAGLADITDALAGHLADFREQVLDFSRQIEAAWPAKTTPDADRQTTEGTSIVDRRRRLAVDMEQHRPTPWQALAGIVRDFGGWQKAANAVDQLNEALSDDAARAAETGAWLVLGPAGQGKTHLLLDGTGRALTDGRLAVVVFGDELKGDDPLTEIARRLGLGDLAYDVLLQAIDAAGVATNARFLLIIDAINDSDEAFRWKTQLPALLARIADYPHVAIALSCRSTLRDVVVPANLNALGLTYTTHPGFDGHEVEALEQYLREVPHALPRTPLLLPAFSNPLFVKLYAEGLRARAQRSGQSVTVAGTQHRSAVFDLFLDTRAEVICDQLHLDPMTKPVHRAVEQLAARMGETGREVLNRDEARTIVDAFAPGKTNYPDTMLGKLQAHGVLATDRYYIPGDEPRMGVAFPYQAFSDDRIIRAVLDLHREELDELRFSGQLATGSPLRQWLQAASAAFQEAATVVLPELAGVELIDILDAAAPATDTAGDQPGPRRYMLFRALLSTLPLREATSISQRTVDLLNQAIREFRQGHAALDAVLAVTTEPDHPLNADRLHRNLLGSSRPQRDAWWGIHIYSTLQEHGPLHRLLRWAEQLPTPNRVCPDRPRTRVARPQARRAATRQAPAAESPEPGTEVVRLAATTLVWTLTSSNRFLRDRATKALVQLLLGYPDILTALLARFLHEDGNRVGDPYLFERLALVAYGVILRAGPAYPEAVGRIAHQLIAAVCGDPASPTHASKHALLCNAARGIIGTAARMGVISKDEAEPADHPHPARTPGSAPTQDQIETRFPSNDSPGESWRSVTFSLREQADFANYKVRPAVNRISRLPISHERPTPTDERRGRPRRLRPSRIAAFRASLPTAARDVIGTVASVEKLLNHDWVARKVLSDEQYQLLQACRTPPPRDEQLFDTGQDEKWAARWIVARVAALVWTPARFGEFDSHHGRGGSSAHKAERIGKKYQWMALHELGERLVNHYHVNTGYEDEKPDPVGFWQIWLRDIDPSLPPAPHRLADEEDYDDKPPADNDPRLATFAPSPPGGFWMPPQPELPDLDHVDDWIVDGGPLPNLEQIAVRTDERGVRWVVLGEYASDTADGRGFDGQEGQAEQWHHIDSWLVRRTQFEPTLDFLEPRMLVPRWMPEARRPSCIYLGEFPDAPAAYDPDRGEPGPDHELRFIDYYAANDTSPARRRHRRAASTGGGSTRPSVSRLLSSDQDQETMLTELARLWSPGYQPAADTHDENDLDDEDPINQLFERLLSTDDNADDDAEEPSYVEVGQDATGAALQALPATQHYGWGASGADCSIDAPVNVHLPANALLAGAHLIRHPDRTDWYDETGTHLVTSQGARRPTGEVTTVLAREDWLDARLRKLGFALLLGLFGNRIPATAEVEHWREYSQVGGRAPGADWRHGSVRTRLKQPAR